MPMWSSTRKVPVPDWGLNDARHGAARCVGRDLETRPPGPDAVWSSTERKARDGAAPLAAAFGQTLRTTPTSAKTTAAPRGSSRSRSSRASPTVLRQPRREHSRLGTRARRAGADRGSGGSGDRGKSPGTGEIAIVTHGGVATLLLCARLGHPIDESLGPGIAGGGGICAVRGSQASAWRAIEAEDALDL
jgi:broad specificity phosphatase PhoE